VHIKAENKIFPEQYFFPNFIPSILIMSHIFILDDFKNLQNYIQFTLKKERIPV
jgi:hypothetical protein